MDRQNTFNRFNFNNDRTLDKHVKPITTIQLHRTVNDGERFLLYNVQTQFAQLER